MDEDTKKSVSLDRKTEDDAKPPHIECEVPRGVLIPGEDDGKRIPLGLVTLKELTGHEEDILANEKINITSRLNQIVGRCIISVSNGEKTVNDKKSLGQLMTTHPYGLSLADSLTLLFRLREVTVGDEFRQKVICPNCTDDEGEKFSWTHIGSLADLEIVPCKGDRAEYQRTFTTERGNVIVWEMLTAAKEEEYARKKLSKDKATRSLMMRVVSINGEKVDKQNLKDLPFKERQEIRKRFDEEGGIDTDIEMVCRNCDHEFKVPLDINARDFFNPSETSET